jgi:hypothetical protein
MKFYKGLKYGGKCKDCGEAVPAGANAWIDGKELHCLKCKPEGTSTEGGGTTPQIQPTTRTVEKVRCPIIQRFVPETEMVTVYTREHLPLRVSQLAVDIITAQYWAKVEGLWTVPRPAKNAITEAAAVEEAGRH